MSDQRAPLLASPPTARPKLPLARHMTGAALALLAAGIITASITACASRGGPVQAPVDLTIAPLSSLSDAGITTTGERTSGQCSLRLVAARIEKSSPLCVLDEHISNTAGLLFYPCSGDGPVEAEFGQQRYRGRLSNGEVELVLETELDWEDGCRWGTRAVIRGTLLSNGEPAGKRLTWNYRDAVLSGSDCSGVCIAKSSFEVTSAKGRAPSLPSNHDGDEGEDDGD